MDDSKELNTLSNVPLQSLQIIELNDNAGWFVRVRKDKHTKTQLENRAKTKKVSSSSKEAWGAIDKYGVRRIIRPNALQRLNPKDARIVRIAVIETAKRAGIHIWNKSPTYVGQAEPTGDEGVEMLKAI